MPDAAGSDGQAALEIRNHHSREGLRRRALDNDRLSRARFVRNAELDLKPALETHALPVIASD